MTGDGVAGRRVVVAGAGVTGRAVARVLRERGAAVRVVDTADGERQQAAAATLAADGVEVRLGATVGDVDGADLVVASPGWRLDQPLLAAARANGTEVIGEPELAWRLRDPGVPWLGVTGTNGKTTTVGMLEAVLLAAGRRTVAAGNVGLPLVDAVTTTPPYDVLAVEVSSQQLAWSPSPRFHAGALLNLAPDHLDWHDTMDAYVAAKTRVWTGATAVAVVDDPRVAALAPPGALRVSLVDADADYAGVGGVLTAGGEPVMRADELRVGGPHNVSNALVALALARTVGVPLDIAAGALREFAPGRHRNETVAEVGGVRYVDDSKATNAHAAAASLAAYPSVVWIAGGLLKGADVDDVVAANAGRLRGVVLLGRDRDVVADALARHAPDVPVSVVTTTDTGAMSEVVRRAAGMARPGDTVLLAPAAASWDMFRDYAERGDLFAAAARALDGAARA
ncbi:MAG: UDP-N-acetylmuramoylalanine--D-glutamate ligase [Frankiaceae bacterium]|jgi:UDP-N-acetylmuramoylalanine--D-glutamate ligase|nr:UDP-N-acetylmuramoylalanine--D-glutamate ligase [Frankiaceae bacterium]